VRERRVSSSPLPDQDGDTLRALLGAPPADLAGALPKALVKSQLLDLADAPALPIDPSRYEWSEVAPGVHVAIVREDAARGMRACLVSGKAGARHPRHRHGGDELILVLEGVLQDERGSYGPGAVCRSRKGDVHSEQAVQDCLCYVVYYGELEMLEG
jgi:putative transcriptional regulator